MEEAMKMFLDRWLESAYPDVTTCYQTGMVVCVVVAAACAVVLLVDLMEPYGIDWVVRHYGSILLLFFLSMIGVFGFGAADANVSRDIRFRMMTGDDHMRERYQRLETYLRTEKDFVETGRFQGTHEHFSESVGNPGK